MAFGDLNGEDIEHQRRLRKLRKKLRQIEHLQVQERERQLNEEEKSKVWYLAEGLMLIREP